MKTEKKDRKREFVPRPTYEYSRKGRRTVDTESKPATKTSKRDAGQSEQEPKA